MSFRVPFLSPAGQAETKPEPQAEWSQLDLEDRRAIWRQRREEQHTRELHTDVIPDELAPTDRLMRQRPVGPRPEPLEVLLLKTDDPKWDAFLKQAELTGKIMAGGVEIAIKSASSHKDRAKPKRRKL